MAVRIPMFRTLMSARSWTAKGEQRTYQMTNGNLLLGAYPGAEGVKIGYTRAAGQTIVGAAVHDGRRLFVAVLGGSTQRVTDAVLLLDRGFAVAP
ncbi:MAG: hypothetical protein NTZ05_15685 [Chloroflexi bacterium]|nr:hypothetical protein [Chloroflexota bacterium]